MKQRILVVLLACASMAVANPRTARAQVDISANVDIQINSPSDFYQPLDSYGTWVDVPQYGRCWQPRGVEADWQPYTIGHWEWTDAGWYWVSDEPWGWACFHYGTWDHDPRYGWCWIPGTDWAPAWVTWRYSDDYIGWAPCGPGLSILAPSFFTFCDVHHFRDHFDRRNLIVNNRTIIDRTKVVKNFKRETVDFNGHQRTVFANRGPGVDPVRKATGQDFKPRPIRDVVRDSHQPDMMRHENNQRPEARPEQKPAEQPRHEATPAPTGREQQRNYQQTQPEQRTPQRDVTPKPEQRPLPPTGRDEVKPQEHHEAAPVRPPEVPRPTPPAEQRREVPAPTAPAERPLPPTGHDDGRAPRVERPPMQAPVERPAEPARPVAPPRDGNHGPDGRDGNH